MRGRVAWALFWILAIIVPSARGDVITTGLNRALANSLYCQLTGCTLTGSVTMTAGTLTVPDFHDTGNALIDGGVTAGSVTTNTGLISNPIACVQWHDTTAGAVDGFLSANGTYNQFSANRNPCTAAIIDATKPSASVALKTGVSDSHIEFYTGTTNNAAGSLNGFIAATGPALFKGSVAFVTTDFTTAANTNLQPIAGLTWTLPANMAANYPFHCELMYSQATAAVADSLGIQTATFAATNVAAKGDVQTAAGTYAGGNLPTLASTTATAIVTFTPSAITTVWNARLTGMIENPSNASTQVVNILIKTSTSGDALTVKRGSYCVMGF